jgi:hypothetical protein
MTTIINVTIHCPEHGVQKCVTTVDSLMCELCSKERKFEKELEAGE